MPGSFALKRPEIQLLIQREVVILEITRHWTRDAIEYIGMGPQFDIVPEGDEVPLYRVIWYDGEQDIDWQRV